jgi:DNA-binding protein HU-beta
MAKSPEMLDLEPLGRSNNTDHIRALRAEFGDEETHMANMSKSDVLSAVAGGAGCTKADAEAVIEAFFGCVEGAAKAGDAVAWPGVGKFSRSDRAARMGRNPQTGATIHISASSSVKFSAAKALKDRMNG